MVFQAVRGQGRRVLLDKGRLLNCRFGRNVNTTQWFYRKKCWIPDGILKIISQDYVTAENYFEECWIGKMSSKQEHSKIHARPRHLLLDRFETFFTALSMQKLLRLWNSAYSCKYVDGFIAQCGIEDCWVKSGCYQLTQRIYNFKADYGKTLILQLSERFMLVATAVLLANIFMWCLISSLKVGCYANKSR